MLLVGLTGGIASGKSLVASAFADLGAVVIDADQLARDIVEPGQPALAAIAREFGDDLIRADGTLDRPALGAVVFSDPEARARLEGITHPAIAALAKDRIAAARDADPEAIVIYDIPLLVETDGARRMNFDHIVVVHADEEVRRQRLLEHRGLSEAEADSRIAAQASDEERLAVADTVIDNNGSIDSTLHKVNEVWGELRSLNARQ